jgi:transcriptional regulator with XRE-family HTH domain
MKSHTEPGSLPRLRELRQIAALSQADLAECSGVARTTITRIETGSQPVYPSTIRKLAKALNVTTAELQRRS